MATCRQCSLYVDTCRTHSLTGKTKGIRQLSFYYAKKLGLTCSEISWARSCLRSSEMVTLLELSRLSFISLSLIASSLPAGSGNHAIVQGARH